MKLKKLLSVVMATAIAISATTIVPANEAEAISVIQTEDDMVSLITNANFMDIDFSTLSSIKINATCSNLNYGYNSIRFILQTGGNSWRPLSCGGSNTYDGAPDILLEDTGSFTATYTDIDMGSENIWFNLGYIYAPDNAFTVDSVYFYDSSSNLIATWHSSALLQTAAQDESNYAVRFVQKVPAGDIEAYDKAIITITNGNTTKTKTVTSCYSSVIANGEKVSAGEGYYFIVCAYKNIPSTVDVGDFSVSVILQ